MLGVYFQASGLWGIFQTGICTTQVSKERKSPEKIIILSSYFDEHILFTYTQMRNEFIFIFQVNEKSGYKVIYNSANLSGRGERYNKKGMTI